MSEDKRCCGSDNEANLDEGCCCSGHEAKADGEGCCCGGEEEFETITLELEDGEEVDCIVLGIFEVDKKEYIALNPMESEEVYLYKYTPDGDDFKLDEIDDDDEYEKVAASLDVLFEAQMKAEDEAED